MDKGSHHFTGSNDQNHPKEKEMQERKVLSENALQVAEKRREAKGQGRKGKTYSTEFRVSKN